MKSTESNYAFIDSQNVNLAIRDQGWRLDWKRFRQYLQDKFHVTKAFIFIGFVADNEALYTALQEAGFICIFKPTLEQEGVTKGNVDAELVLHTMLEWDNFDRAVIVSGDGDFRCLIEHLLEKDKLERLMIPNQNKFSSLLRHFGDYMIFMNKLQKRLEYRPQKKKEPKREQPKKEQTKKKPAQSKKSPRKRGSGGSRGRKSNNKKRGA